jgi:hypothetical protein
MSRRPVGIGTGLAVVGTMHAAVNARLLRRPVPGPATGLPSVSVLVPARDEAAAIEACVRSARVQDVPVELIVLDDGSADGTADLARAAGARVIDGTPPPDGWLGKPWACAQLAAAASGEVLVFLDADVVLAPSAVRAAVSILVDTGLDLVSPHPRQVAGGVAERLVQPLLQWSVLTTLPLRLAERSARPSLSAANGQFLVIRRTALQRAGGPVRDAVLDDIALLRAVKRSGGRGVLVDGTDLAVCRMYASWPELRDGYGKSLWAAFGTPAGAAGALALLGLAYVVPAVAAARGSRLGLAGYAAGVASRAIAARRTGGRAWPDALAHPVSVTLFGYLTARSIIEHRRGRLTWKGRPLPA